MEEAHVNSGSKGRQAEAEGINMYVYVPVHDFDCKTFPLHSSDQDGSLLAVGFSVKLSTYDSAVRRRESSDAAFDFP